MVLVYNRPVYTKVQRGDTIDQIIFNEALVLTLVGVSTAFVTLIVLMLIVPAIRFLANYIDNKNSELISSNQEEDHEKATAAVVAIGTLLALSLIHI